MPNHVFNTMVVSASKSEVEAIIEAGGFARKFKPMPKELENTTSPCKIVSQVEYDSQTKDTFAPGITQAMQDDFIERFGHDNWYDWAYANWGTKWGDYNHTDWDIVDTLDGGCEVKYMTAWSPLSEKIIELIDHHLDIREYMWEEEQGFGESYEKWVDELVLTNEWDTPEIDFENPMYDEEGNEYYKLLFDHKTPFVEAKAGWYQDGEIELMHPEDESKLKTE